MKADIDVKDGKYIMATAYLIGGTPRTGKTTLTMRCIRQHPMLAASTDAIRYTLRQVVDPIDQPDLFHLGKFTSNNPEKRNFLRDYPMDVVAIQNAESAIVWKSVNDFIQSNIVDGFDVLIEGIAVLPEFVSGLKCDYRAVFIGNKSDEHYQTILNSARSNPNDWMHSLEDETIEAFATFNQTFSAFIEQQAQEYGMHYVEIHDANFEADINTALRLLRSEPS